MRTPDRQAGGGTDGGPGQGAVTARPVERRAASGKQQHGSACGNAAWPSAFSSQADAGIGHAAEARRRIGRRAANRAFERTIGRSAAMRGRGYCVQVTCCP